MLQPRPDEHNSDDNSPDLPLIAFLARSNEMKLEPASERRKWMDATAFSFANRCLPLKLANQAGWVILNDRKIEVTWNGGTGASNLIISHFRKQPFENIVASEMSAVSHFGYGIITWRIPYLFRTPRGYNLYVRGPTNWFKDGATALDAIVETDWAVATFTMNWKITRVGVPLLFERDEPICMVFPIRRGAIERFVPEIRKLEDDPNTATEYQKWYASRKGFNQQPRVRRRDYARWQKHYFNGLTPAGSSFSDHQVRLDVRPVKDTR